MNRPATFFTCFVNASLLLSSPLDAKVAPTTLKELTIGSESIVVGRVTSVVDLKTVWVATLRVTRTLKGPEVSEIAYLAQGTWTCDISGAEQGEEVLLFLERYEFDPSPQPEDEREPDVWTSEFKEPAGFGEEVSRLGLKAPFMAISWSGRGRMPVRYVDGDAYVTIWTADVQLPHAVRTIEGPEREYSSFIRSAKMAEVLDLIRKWSPRRN